jgi:hypothetical protein
MVTTIVTIIIGITAGDIVFSLAVPCAHVIIRL